MLKKTLALMAVIFALSFLQEDQSMQLYALPLTMLLLIIWAGGMLWIKKQWEGADDEEVFNDSIKEVPQDYTPAEAIYILTGKKATQRELLATLLDLVRRRVLDLRIVDLLDKSTDQPYGRDYVFQKNVNTDSKKLSFHEKVLFMGLLERIGDGKQFSISDIGRFIRRSREDAQDFYRFLFTWKFAVERDIQKNKAYEGIGCKTIFKGLLLGAGLFIAGGLISAELEAPYAAIISILGLILCFSTFKQPKRTAYGNQEYHRLRSIEAEIKELANTKFKPLPTIELWEHYLVYCLPMGVEKEINKLLPEVLKRSHYDHINYEGLAGTLFHNSVDYTSEMLTMLLNYQKTLQSATKAEEEKISLIN